MIIGNLSIGALLIVIAVMISIVKMITKSDKLINVEDK